MLDFPILLELRDQGLTDYFAFTVWFNEELDFDDLSKGIVGSWCTDRKTGFTNVDLRSLNRIEQRLAVAFKNQYSVPDHRKYSVRLPGFRSRIPCVEWTDQAW